MEQVGPLFTAADFGTWSQKLPEPLLYAKHEAAGGRATGRLVDSRECIKDQVRLTFLP